MLSICSLSAPYLLSIWVWSLCSIYAPYLLSICSLSALSICPTPSRSARLKSSLSQLASDHAATQHAKHTALGSQNLALARGEEREREARRRWADAEERAARLKEMVDNGERDRERLEGELQAALSGVDG
jgi:hypothetical protein